MPGRAVAIADYDWSRGTCQPQPPEEFWWWGIPGSGTWGWTARFGQFWIGGIIYQIWAWAGYECGLGPPVKPASSDFYLQWPGGDEGQWFRNGAIVRIHGQWQIRWGNFGQYAGRLTEGQVTMVPTSLGLSPPGDPPPITEEMSADVGASPEPTKEPEEA